MLPQGPGAGIGRNLLMASEAMCFGPPIRTVLAVDGRWESAHCSAAVLLDGPGAGIRRILMEASVAMCLASPIRQFFASILVFLGVACSTRGYTPRPSWVAPSSVTSSMGSLAPSSGNPSLPELAVTCDVALSTGPDGVRTFQPPGCLRATCEPVPWGDSDGYGPAHECTALAKTTIAGADRGCRQDSDCTMVLETPCATHAARADAAAKYRGRAPPCAHPQAGQCAIRNVHAVCFAGCCQVARF